MWHRMTKECRMGIICLCWFFKLKVVCQGCGFGSDGGLEKGSGNHLNCVITRIPSFIFLCHNTFVNSFS